MDRLRSLRLGTRIIPLGSRLEVDEREYGPWVERMAGWGGR